MTGEEVQIDLGEILSQEEDLMIMKEVLDREEKLAKKASDQDQILEREDSIEEINLDLEIEKNDQGLIDQLMGKKAVLDQEDLIEKILNQEDLIEEGKMVVLNLEDLIEMAKKAVLNQEDSIEMERTDSIVMDLLEDSIEKDLLEDSIEKLKQKEKMKITKLNLTLILIVLLRNRLREKKTLLILTALRSLNSKIKENLKKLCLI